MAHAYFYNQLAESAGHRNVKLFNLVLLEAEVSLMQVFCFTKSKKILKINTIFDEIIFKVFTINVFHLGNIRSFGIIDRNSDFYCPVIKLFELCSHTKKIRNTNSPLVLK